MNRQIIDIGLTFGRQIVLLGIGFVSLPLLAQLLGPEKVGAFSVLTATIAIISTLGGGGTGPAYLYFAGKSRLGKDRIAKVVWQLILAGLVISLIGILIAGPLLLRSEYLAEIESTTYIYLAAILGLALLQAPITSIARCEKRFGLIAIFEIANRVARVALLGILLYCGLNGLSHLLLYTIAINLVVTTSWWTYFLCRKKRDTLKIENEVRFGELAIYSWKSAGANVIAQLNYRLDVFLLLLWSTDFQLGIYGIAVMIAEKAWMLSKSVGEVSLAYLTQSDSEEEQMIGQALVTAKWTGLITFGICAAICVAIPVLPYLLGSRFIGVGWPLLFLAPGILALGISRIISNALSALGRPGLNLLFGLAGVALNVLMNYLLIPSYGATGAAIATSTSYTFLLSLRIIYLKFAGYQLTPLFKISSEEIALIKSRLKSRFRTSS